MRTEIIWKLFGEIPPLRLDSNISTLLRFRKQKLERIQSPDEIDTDTDPTTDKKIVRAEVAENESPLDKDRIGIANVCRMGEH